MTELFCTLRIHLAIRGKVGHPGRKILYTRRNGIAAQQVLSVVFQRKQIQQHLQAHTIEHIAVVKILSAGFVIHHPVVVRALPVPGIHPVHKAPENGIHAPIGNGNGRKAFPSAEADLKSAGLEPGLLQLLPQFADHHIQLPDVPAEQIGHSVRRNLAEPLSGIFFTETVGNFQGFLHGNGRKPAHVPDAPGSIFQHCMDIGAEFRRIYRDLLPFLCLQAIFQEIGHPAFRLPVNLRSRQIQGFSVQGPDIFQCHLADAVIFLDLHCPVGLQHIQLLGSILRIPFCQPGTCFLRVCHAKAPNILRMQFITRKICQPAEHKRGLLSGAIHPDAFPCPAENAINFSKFILNAFHGTAGQRYAQLTERHPLLVGQNTGRTGIAGQAAFLGTQKNQMLLLITPHGADRTHLHRIQHRRNGAHIILAQQQTEQPCKMLRLPHGMPQHIMELFQGRQKDLPQLVQYLRIAVIPGSIHFLCHEAEFFSKMDGFQKTVQGKNLLLHIGCLPESLLQGCQGSHHRFPGIVQEHKLHVGTLVPGFSQSRRMKFPV